MTVKTEHKAVLDTMRELERQGFEVTYLDVQEDGLLDLDKFKAALRTVIDDIWYVDVDDALRRERLIARHVRYCRSLAAAQAWVSQTDEPNACLIAASRARADFMFRGEHEA